jgi:DNA-directed RNA polymerase specialized sigma24 family protein
MSSIGSVTRWIEQLKAGEEAALGELHKRYWPFLVELARRKLGAAPRRATDEEDVAQQAFWGFYQTLKAGRLPRLANRYDLLALLTHITACQAINQIKHEVAVQKRGGGRVRDEAMLHPSADSSEPGRGLDAVPDPGTTPAEQAMLHDCYDHYVNALPEHLRPFAELCLAGCTHHQIADQLGCTERTVDRKMVLIMAKWQRMTADSMIQKRP